MDMDAVVLGFIRTVADRTVSGAGANKWLEGEPSVYPPDRIDRVGDLVVVDNVITWFNPEHTRQGGFIHRVPDGTHPVYAAGTLLDTPYDTVPQRYCVNSLLISFVEPERLTMPNWDWGYDDTSQQLEDYACLMSDRACRATQEDPQNAAIARARETLLADRTRTSRDNWTNDVVDPETGANMLAFPVTDGNVCGFEARNDEDELLAVYLVNCPQ